MRLSFFSLGSAWSKRRATVVRGDGEASCFRLQKTGFGIGIDEKWKLWEMITFSHREREMFYTVRIEKVEKLKIV